MSTLAGAFDAALLDLDGTLYEGEAAIEGAHAGLHRRWFAHGVYHQ